MVKVSYHWKILKTYIIYRPVHFGKAEKKLEEKTLFFSKSFMLNKKKIKQSDK